MERIKAIRRRVFEIVDKAEDGDWASKLFDGSIMVLIALSILSIILESFPDINAKYRSVFQAFEVISVVIFTVEYLLRIWTADLLYPDAKYPRLKYLFSFMAIIDLLAILPFYLPFFAADLRYLRIMRLFRLARMLRLFKLGRYSDALQTIGGVIKDSKAQLVMSVVVCLFIILLSAIVMYTVEYPVQPEKFPNVIASLWWALCTLTTVGYGDVYPVTVVGRIFASVISLVGIGIIAIPTGIIAAGFNRAIHDEVGERQGEPEGKPSLAEDMGEEELLALPAKLAKRLKQYGYSTTVTNETEKIKE